MAVTNREKLVRELLELRKIYAPHEPRDKEIRAILIKEATGDDENFKVTVDGLGHVNVSRSQPARLTGTAPEVVIEKFLALPKTERTKLIRRGIVRIADQKKDAYSGRVTVELY